MHFLLFFALSATLERKKSPLFFLYTILSEKNGFFLFCYLHILCRFILCSLLKSYSANVKQSKQQTQQHLKFFFFFFSFFPSLHLTSFTLRFSLQFLLFFSCFLLLLHIALKHRYFRFVRTTQADLIAQHQVVD